MSTFLSRYLDSLTGASGPVTSPARARGGYSFGERYWASLTRTPLPSRPLARTSRSKPAPASFEAPTAAAALYLTAGPAPAKAHEAHDPPQASALRRRRVAGLVAMLLAMIIVSFAFAAGKITGAVYAVTTIAFYTAAAVIFIRSFGLLRHSIASMSIVGAVISLSLVAVAAATGISSTQPEPAGAHAITGAPPLAIPPRSEIFGIGKITSPTEGFLPDAGKILRVSGAVFGVPLGYHLVLFVYSPTDDGLYAADIDVIIKNGRWTGSIYPSRGEAAIVLAALSPEGYKRLNGAGPAGSGFLYSLVSSGGAAVLDYVSVYVY